MTKILLEPRAELKVRLPESITRLPAVLVLTNVNLCSSSVLHGCNKVMEVKSTFLGDSSRKARSVSDFLWPSGFARFYRPALPV